MRTGHPTISRLSPPIVSITIILIIVTFARQSSASRISFFTDPACSNFTYDVQGPNGYPDGQCSLLNTKGDFGSFKVVRLDRGCDATLYGPNVSEGICSPDGAIVALPGRCYNSSTWTYYSIDTCVRQEADDPASSSSSSAPPNGSGSSAPSVAAPQATASSSSAVVSADSGTNTGAIAGGVVGGVVGLALILGGVWFLLRRRRKPPAGPPSEVVPGEMSGSSVVEVSGREVAKPSELPEARAEAFVEPPPQELSAGADRAVGSGREKPVLR